ncbi:MAG: NAD+ synthase [Pseudomonadota bacterium]
MTDAIRIALAQINPTVGDLAGNLSKIRQRYNEAIAANADLIVFPELAVVGYPPEDLVLNPLFQQEAGKAIMALAADTSNGGPAMVLGTPCVDDGALYNAAAVLRDGQIAAMRFKHKLPNYGVFDEQRLFATGPIPTSVRLPGRGGRLVRLGVMICEDLWSPEVSKNLAASGTDILIALNASPFEQDKLDQRIEHAKARVSETGLPLVYVNQVGGQDELVFDGASFALNADGTMAGQAASFKEQLLLTDWQRSAHGVWHTNAMLAPKPVERSEAIYGAMMLGLRDYVEKNRFPGIILGLSGGIDSALSAAIAVDALGAARVRAVMMPSQYTSQQSLIDANAIANALDISLETIPIEPMVTAFAGALEPTFAGTEPDVTEENLQARIRGVILMALSNKFGDMVLTTGNKSEMSIGYSTLYGDLCGGFSVLKDVDKTTVFALTRWRNGSLPGGGLGPKGNVFPETVITKPPSAELRTDQTDQDTLPPYEILDAILDGLVHHDRSPNALVRQGYDRAVVERVTRLLDLAEYKRRQAPPGVKISRRAFGRDRRYPITNGFHQTAASKESVIRGD